MQNTTTLKRFPYTVLALALVIAIIVGIVVATSVLNASAPAPAARDGSGQPGISSNAPNSPVGLIGRDTVDVTVNGNRER